jgi:general nucleoside transport system ATP-binding protein
MIQVSKNFAGVAALERVDLVVTRGGVHALLGENGAGKTTLMRIAYGLLAADAGTIDLFGARLLSPSVRTAVAAGVGMVHQHLSLVPNLSPAENLVLGGRGLFHRRAADALLARTAEQSGLRIPRVPLVRELSLVEQQRLEILKALSHGARLLILDEPTAILAPSESDELLRWIRGFTASGGSVILVTHKLREALAVADRVTVLRRGHVVHSGAASEASEASLARAMFPESAASTVSTPRTSPAEVVARLSSVDVRDDRGAIRARGATFDVRRHEILGIAAIEGSGHRELLLALAGRRRVGAGTADLPARIAFVPADRQREALIPGFDLIQNVALHGLGRRRGLMPWHELAVHTAALIRRFSIVASAPTATAASLSGGNQQRLVIARELEHEVDMLVADNPTRGLDIQASTFVHEQLRQAAARGMAVVVHSSDVDEVLALATRVLVVFHGEVREVARDRDLVGRAMLGAA